MIMSCHERLGCQLLTRKTENNYVASTPILYNHPHQNMEERLTRFDITSCTWTPAKIAQGENAVNYIIACSVF